MAKLLASLTALAILLTSSTTGFGQQPEKEKDEGELLPLPKEKQDTLPPPRMFPPNVVILPYAPTPFPQHGTRDVWQLYAVDRSGRFRPRVILSPYGAYYAANGAPFPMTTTRPLLYMPYVVD